MHNKTFKVVTESSMTFFDTTPSGRIINRLAKDIDEMDLFLPWMMEGAIRNVLRNLFSLLVIPINVPWFLVAIAPLLVVFIFLNKLYRASMREIKRMDNNTRAPIFTQITATVQGLTTIRGYNAQQSFIGGFADKVNDNTLPFYCYNMCMRWFSVRLECLMTLLVAATAVALIMLKDSIPSALAGLCLTLAFRTTMLLNYTCRLLADAESRMTSVERVNNYMAELKPEGEFEDKDENDDKWPIDSSVEFDNVSLRYREGLPLVLDEVSFKVEPAEKIGVVGRTGAGKSSLAIAIYRLVNAESGVIRIAGKNTAGIGLKRLRSHLSIIPQDPILFIGSLRYNLDPFDRHSEAELWQALEKAHIKDTVSELEDKLETTVKEGGSNFSVGERQLLCIARALLRNSKILILDEATAAIDTQTDQKIQATMREAFHDCTIITIAHRLNTILDYDKILVMDCGQVHEFDAPASLLQDTESMFYKMAAAANLKTLSQSTTASLDIEP